MPMMEEIKNGREDATLAELAVLAATDVLRPKNII